jgi:ferrous-iron efflux pump FieF
MGRPDDAKKIKAARFSITAALFLSVFKLATGFWFHSLSMVSAGVDSVMDLLASAINLFSMKKSVQPADEEHPYGHGKIENIASLVQAGLIGVAGLLLIEEGIRRSIHLEKLPNFDGGIVVMIVSGTLSFLVGRRLLRIGRETDSPLLKADALHFSIDTYTNAGVVIALILSVWSRRVIFDRIAAILIGVWVLYSAYRIFRSALDALMDRTISQDLQEQIDRIILDHCKEIIGYHRMRTRRSGSQKMIDLHLVICRDVSLTQAHAITEELEKKIEKTIHNSDVVIHIEPCTQDCPQIRDQCFYKTDLSSSSNPD